MQRAISGWHNSPCHIGSWDADNPSFACPLGAWDIDGRFPRKPPAQWDNGSPRPSAKCGSGCNGPILRIWGGLRGTSVKRGGFSHRRIIDGRSCRLSCRGTQTSLAFSGGLAAMLGVETGSDRRSGGCFTHPSQRIGADRRNGGRGTGPQPLGRCVVFAARYMPSGLAGTV